MELRRGITGFRKFDEPPLPLCDVSAFYAHCYAAAHSVGGRIVRRSRHPDKVVANFTMAVLEVSGEQIAILLNSHFPVVAFAIPPGEGETGPLRFIDGGGLADVMRATNEYNVMGRADLEQSVHEENFDKLAGVEMEQVKYWRPARVGDLVFNFWD